MAFSSMPSMSKAAMKVARQWQNVPESLSDEEVLAQGLIPPEVIELVMQIFLEVIMNCLDNNQVSAFRRIQIFQSAKKIDRMADNLRLNTMINRWFTHLGRPREPGDVVALREAIANAVSGVSQEDFAKVQNEALWVGI